MITFDNLTLKAFLDENIDFLTGARIQKIQQPTRRDFVFAIRNAGETRKLYININPQFFHICFMSKENEERRMIEIPAKPPMFCMLLRKYLENSRISKVVQPEGERILEFYIETYNELSEKIYLCLAVELMGKHSNVILYNYDTNVIIGCAHNVGAEKSSVRELAGTMPYTYPPRQLNKGEINYVSLIDEVAGDSVNSIIDNYYAARIEEYKFKQMKNNLYSFVNQKLKKDKSSLEKMQRQIIKEEKADKYRLYGDLIMANLYNNSDYSSVITVFDYENNKELTIELDETKTLKENANRFYKLYNKSKTSMAKLIELIENYQADVNYYAQVLYSLGQSKNIKDLLEIKHEVQPESVSKEMKKSALAPLEIEIGGCKVFVGKNNRQNDIIISKLAKDEDYWFHTKDCAGSHVLLKCAEPSDDLILSCAKLAKEYSSCSYESKVGVIYTKRKYLRKPPGAKLGYVTYKNEKEIVI